MNDVGVFLVSETQEMNDVGVFLVSETQEDRDPGGQEKVKARWSVTGGLFDSDELRLSECACGKRQPGQAGLRRGAGQCRVRGWGLGLFRKAHRWRRSKRTRR